MNAFVLITLSALFALSCTGNKATPVIAGGTSEETNTLAYDNERPTALSFKQPGTYVSSAEFGEKFSVARSFEISAWLKIDSLPQKSAEPHNIIGKFNAASDKLPSELSLVLVNGACGAEEPVFAFFLTDESSVFACEQAVVSKNPVKAGLWTFVEAKWDGRYLTLYQDGVVVAREEKISPVLPYSESPIYLGKSKIPFAIDRLSLNTEAL
jgi:hypothetical protein